MKSRGASPRDWRVSFGAAAITLVIAASAGAISRSGGGKIKSSDLGFVADSPAEYGRASAAANEGLRLWSDRYFGGASGLTTEAFIEIRQFGFEFPDLANSDRASTSSDFTSKGWTQFRAADPCVDIFEKKSATVTSTTVVWGPGKGILILAGVFAPSIQATQQIVDSLSLDSGSCAW